MIIKTKKNKLDTKTYIKLGIRNTITEQWWVFLIALGIMSGTFFVKTIWFVIGAIIALLFYFLFWIVQYYGVTYLDQNKMLFEPLRYEISSQHILMQINAKQGMPISWDQVKKVSVAKDYFLLTISRAHLIYLPHRIFNTKHEIKFFETILKRKGLLK